MGKTWGLEEFTAVDVVSFIVGLFCTAPAGNCFENRTIVHSREKIIVTAITFNPKVRSELEAALHMHRLAIVQLFIFVGQRIYSDIRKNGYPHCSILRHIFYLLYLLVLL
jgi:hypothetical protein